MPVDEANIDTMLAALRARITTLTGQVNDIYKLLERLESVEKDGQGNNKLDNSTMSQMTDPRRQEIYDSIVTDFSLIP